jgi:hypothetical protein
MTCTDPTRPPGGHSDYAGVVTDDLSRDDARRLLAAATERHAALQADIQAARVALFDVVTRVYDVLPKKEITDATGWSREQIRLIAAGLRKP